MNQETPFESELLATLGELRRAHPEWRFGQMVANIAMTAGRLESSGVWDLEDEEALAAARELLTQAEATQSTAK